MTATTIDRFNGINGGLAIKAPCRVATTANITLSGEQTVDGVAVVAGDRVLVKDQSTGADNGIYEASTSAWSRSADFDGNNDIVTGTLVFVILGTTNAATFWRVSTSGSITVGTTSIAFTASANQIAGVSAFMQTVLDDTDAATARTTLGALSSAANQVANSNLAQVATATFKGRTTAGTGNVEDLTVTQATALLDNMVGDSGSGGTKGLAPAPASGDAAANKFLKASGSWSSVSVITLSTPQASTSGTSIDFTGIPAGKKRITINFVGVSTSGTDDLLIQLGDSGGVETSGYLGSGGASDGGGTASDAFTTGFGIRFQSAAAVRHGSMVLNLQNSSTNTWCCFGVLGLSNSGSIIYTGGSKSLSAVLDRVRITTLSGANTFDAGEINISYE